MSAAAVGLEPDAGVADPAVLLPRFIKRDRDAQPGRIGRFYKWNYGLVRPQSLSPKALGVSAVRLGQRMRLITSEARGAKSPGVIVQTSRTNGDFVTFLRRLWAFDRIETDAFHVAVAADAYGIPWRPLRWEFKWQDHFSMFGLAERPEGFVLSERQAVRIAQSRLIERRDALTTFMSEM
jgi:hypothetical protein